LRTLKVKSEKPPVKRKPRAFQRRAVEWLVGHAGAGLFIDPGGGKTGIVLRTIAALKQNGVLNRALIVTLLRPAYEVWPKEPAEWQGTEWDCVNDLKIVVLHGPRKDEMLKEDADVFVINVDGLKWLLENGAYKKFKKLAIDTFIVDESTLVKSWRTKRIKLLKPVLPTFARRWILTGTPNPNGYMDLFAQIFIVDLGRALGRYITHYRMEYFDPVDRFGWDWRLRPGSEERIQKAIAPYIFRLDAKDYIEMPEIVENVIRVDLPPEARKIYDEMEEELLTQLEGEHTVLAVSSGVAAMKCAQIANGGLFHMAFDNDERTGRRTWTDLHTAKIDAVREIVDELNGSPALIVYDFRHDLARLQAAFPRVPYVGGGVSAKESGAIFDAWNADQLPLLFVHPQSVSHGLNLQGGAARHIIWHSLTYSREHYDQLNRRLARQGSRHKNIFVHLIVARNTIDEPKLRALKKKGNQQQAFLDALKAYAAERKR
jgi:SNF2 family DNA or RNA helicase